MPGKESRGIEEKKQFFQYGLLPDILYLLILMAGYRTAAMQLSSVYPLFSSFFHPFIRKR